MKYIIYFVALLCFTAFQKADVSRLSVNMNNQSLVKGKKVTIKAEIFFKYNEGVIVTHYITPLEYITITNKKGEARFYYPDKNEVSVNQNDIFATEHN